MPQFAYKARRRSGETVSGVLDVPDRIAREIYGYDLILIRPDMHVVWRGNAPPEDPADVAAIATGHAPEMCS